MWKNKIPNTKGYGFGEKKMICRTFIEKKKKEESL